MSETLRLLVTGGCGFIGCNFVRLLLDEAPDVHVVNLDALTYAGNPENLAAVADHPRYSFVHGDIRDATAMDELVATQRIDGIVNFAAESHVDRSITGAGIFVETNVTGTLNLLEAARRHGIRRFLQVSTDEVYGSLGPEGKFTETTPLSPNSPYSASKAAADHLVHAYHHTHGLDCVVTRCSNNYGPYQFPEKMIPLMFNNARRDEPLPVYGDGLQVRDWLYVVDHCRALWLVWRQGQAGCVYNIGGENEQTNLAVVRQILAFLGKPESLIHHVKDRPGHDRRYAIDASRIREELGWTPSVDFANGLRRTLQWYLEHEDWMRRITSGEYQHYYRDMYGQRGDAES